MLKMKLFEKTISINSSIETVYKCLSENQHILMWNDLIIGTKFENSKESSYFYKGQRFKSIQKFNNKEFEADFKIENIEAPFYLNMQTMTDQGVSNSEFRLRQEGNKTKVTILFTVVPSNVYYQLVFFLSKFGVKKLYSNQFDKLKLYSESIYN